MVSIPMVKLSKHSLQWLICFSGFLDLFGVSMLFPLLVHHARSLGATPSQVGLFGSIYGTMQFFFSPIMGQLSDHVGRKRVIVVALLGTSVNYILLGQATSIFMLCLFRIPSGIFKFSQSTSRTLLADISSQDHTASVFGMFNSMSSLGFIVGPAIGGIIASRDEGFHDVSVFASLLFLLNAILIFLFVPTQPESLDTSQSPDSSKGGFSLRSLSPFSIFKDVTLIPWSKVWKPFLIKFLFALAIIIFRSNFTSILTFRFNVDTKTNGFIMSYNGVVSAIGSASVRWISPFFTTNDSLHNTFSIVLVSSLLLITLAPSLTVVLVGIIPLCIGSSVLRVTNSVATYEKGGKEVRGLLIGLSDTFTAFSRALGPAIGGFAQEATLYGPGLCGTFFAVLATIVGLLGSDVVKTHVE